MALEDGLERWKLVDALQQSLPHVRYAGKQQAFLRWLEDIPPHRFQCEELAEPAPQRDEPPELLKRRGGQAGARKNRNSKTPRLRNDELVAVHELDLTRPLLESLADDVDAHCRDDHPLHPHIKKTRLNKQTPRLAHRVQEREDGDVSTIVHELTDQAKSDLAILWDVMIPASLPVNNASWS